MARRADPIAAATRDRLAADLEQWRVEHDVPGVALAVVGPGERRCTMVRGVTDAPTGEPLRAEHRFQIGSISKVVTALAVLRAVDAGRIALADPVVSHVPWFRAGPWTRRITIHHLLCHLAGLPIGPDWSDASAYDVWALRDLDVQPPGQRYWYSNVGYKTLGCVLQAVHGGSVPEVVEREVLRPLGLAAAAGRVGPPDPAKDSRGHEPEPDRYPRSLAPRVRAPELRGSMGDGNIAASIDDAATLAMALLRLYTVEDSLLSTGGSRALFEPHARIDRNHGYGYGLGVERTAGRTLFGHGGDMVGFRSSLIADPVADVAVVVLANLRGAPTRDLSRHALDVARAADPAAVPPLATRRSMDLGLAGTYRDERGTARLHLEPDTATLSIDRIDLPLRPLDAGTFEVLDPSAGRHHLAVVPAGRGRGPALSFGSRFLEREPVHSTSRAARNGAPRGAALTGTYRSGDPWSRSVEILVRDGRLRLVDDEGTDGVLVRVGRHRYRVGVEPNPERAIADAWADGRPLRVVVSGRPLARDA